MKRTALIAWGSVVVSIALWVSFGLLVWQLAEARAHVSQRESDLIARDERDRMSAQLQTLMRDTREERETLANLSSVDALAAAATIEAVGKKAGVTVSIASAVSNEAQEGSTNNLRAVTFVANAEGDFARLMRVAQLLETLPFPSRVQSYEFSAQDVSKTQKNAWRMSVHIHAIILDTQ